MVGEVFNEAYGIGEHRLVTVAEVPFSSSGGECCEEFVVCVGAAMR